MLVTDVGDEMCCWRMWETKFVVYWCWRRNVLATTLRCWWRFSPFFCHQHPLSFKISVGYQQPNVEILSLTYKNCHQVKSSKSTCHQHLCTRCVGDIVMLVTLWWWLIWDWQNHYVGDFFRYVGDFRYVLNRSLTSWIGHQHLKLVTNIDVTKISLSDVKVKIV